MDALVGLQPYLPGLPLILILAAICTRLALLWNKALRELEKEGAKHRATQRELDAEREHRRKVEDRMNELTWEVRALKAEVGRLRAQLGEVA